MSQGFRQSIAGKAPWRAAFLDWTPVARAVLVVVLVEHSLQISHLGTWKLSQVIVEVAGASVVRHTAELAHMQQLAAFLRHAQYGPEQAQGRSG